MMFMIVRVWYDIRVIDHSLHCGKFQLDSPEVTGTVQAFKFSELELQVQVQVFHDDDIICRMLYQSLMISYFINII